jgi:hypothetical protein
MEMDTLGVASKKGEKEKTNLQLSIEIVFVQLRKPPILTF